MKGSMEPPKELPPWRKQPLATIEKNPVDPMDKQISGQALDDKGVSKPLKDKGVSECVQQSEFLQECLGEGACQGPGPGLSFGNQR